MVALVVVKIVVPALGGTGVVQFAPVASHAAMVADALREAQRAVDDVVRRLRVVAGDARRAN